MTYDAIVLGVGGVGSAALYHLAKRGVRALGIDRFGLAHDRGSSHGQSRIIRQAYYEHSDYVPLLLRAYERWAELEAASGVKLYFQTGLLQVGPPEGDVVSGVLKSAKRHQLSVERLAPTEIHARWPAFAVAPDHVGAFEPKAGYLLVEECVRAHVQRAQAMGAAVHWDEPVREWRVDGAGVTVETDRGRYSAGRLIVTAGSWAGRSLDFLTSRLEVRRKSLFWFATEAPEFAASGGCPCFLFEQPEGVFYGMPSIDERGLKAAEHTGGEPVADPLSVDRSEQSADRRRVEQFLRGSMPQLAWRRSEHAVCMYTMSPDGHFIVDHAPGAPNVAYAAGLSGHGFKFVSVLGEALTELALDGATRLPIGFLSSRRLAATNAASS